ncbi:MAG: DUF3307 domain-containing protein [Firmicutes bacterium]|nr:DUF3307 domain-containing protein [Bacillota bacterium]
MNLFLLAIIAHLAGDFLFQSPNTVTAKQAGNLWAFIRHALLVAFLTLLATHFFGLGPALLYAGLIGLSHFIIDLGKESLAKGRSGGIKLFLFLTDQALHLLFLFFLTLFFPSAEPHPEVMAFYQRFLPLQTIPVFAGLPRLPELNWEAVLWIIIFYLAAIFGGAVLTSRLLEFLTGQPEGHSQRLGRAIGMIERLILITLVIVDAVSAMGFVLAAKSLARYQELNDREFAEYYLVGTLTSYGLALFAGLGLKRMIS